MAETQGYRAPTGGGADPMPGDRATAVAASARTRSHSRAIVIGALLLIVCLLAINAAIVWRHRENTLREIETDLAKISLALAEQADRTFQSVDLVLTNIEERLIAEDVRSSADLARKASTAELHQLLKAKTIGLQQLDAITVIDAEGQLLNFNRYWPIPKVNIADRDYFQALKNDPARKVFVSAPVQNRGNGTWTIYLARRLSDPDGGFMGLVLGGLRLAYFEDYFRAIVDNDGSAISLLRDEGMLLARFPRTPGIGQVYPSQARMQAMRGGVAGTVRERSPIDGTMRLKAMHALATFPLLVLATMTEDAALREWRELRLLVAGGALVSALAIVVAALLLVRHGRQRGDLVQARADRAAAERARLMAEAELEYQQARTATFEAMKRAKEAAESASRTKSDFLAMMSHELRTPLNAIIGFSDLIAHEIMGKAGVPAYCEYARDINASGRHLLGVINDILDLSRADAGMLMLRRERVDLAEVLDEVVRIIQQRATEGGVDFAVDCALGNPAIVVDERKVKQMLLNLLSNAVKFTPSGGRIVLSVTSDGQDIVFAVRDTGIGISEIDLPRVMEPFVQVDSSLSRKHDGTGLGLPLVKAMAELHGGSLSLESKLGEGTVATLRLPMTDVANDAEAVPAVARADTAA